MLPSLPPSFKPAHIGSPGPSTSPIGLDGTEPLAPTQKLDRLISKFEHRVKGKNRIQFATKMLELHTNSPELAKQLRLCAEIQSFIEPLSDASIVEFETFSGCRMSVFDPENKEYAEIFNAQENYQKIEASSSQESTQLVQPDGGGALRSDINMSRRRKWVDTPLTTSLPAPQDNAGKRVKTDEFLVTVDALGASTPLPDDPVTATPGSETSPTKLPKLATMSGTKDPLPIEASVSAPPTQIKRVAESEKFKEFDSQLLNLGLSERVTWETRESEIVSACFETDAKARHACKQVADGLKQNLGDAFAEKHKLSSSLQVFKSRSAPGFRIVIPISILYAAREFGNRALLAMKSAKRIEAIEDRFSGWDTLCAPIHLVEENEAMLQKHREFFETLSSF